MKCVNSTILCGLLPLSLSVLAVNEADMLFTGTLLDTPTCTVNGNNIIDVSFGDDIITTHVDGVNYKKTVPYTITCSALAQTALKMKLNGTAAGFMNGLLFKTSNTGLGVRFSTASTDILPGGSLNFNYNSQPVLYAVPVANNSSTLTTGVFSGTATMVISYQ